MFPIVERMRSRVWPRAAALVFVSVGIGACSGETTRFNENPFASRSGPETTGSVQQAAPVTRVESRPLGAQPPYPQGVAGGGGGMASYTPHPAAANAPTGSDVTGAIAPPRTAPI